MFQIAKGNFKRVGKVLVAGIWSALLLSSSIFSYVSIASVAYKDEILQQDAEHVLNVYCLSQNYQLLDTCNEALTSYSLAIRDYIKDLVTEEGGVNFSKDETAALQTYISSLEQAETDNSYDDIRNILNTRVIRERLNLFLGGNYNANDVSGIKTLIASKVGEITQKIKEIDAGIQRDQKNLEDYNARSKQFTNLTNPNYIELQNNIQTTDGRMQENKSIKTILQDVKSDLENCKAYVLLMKSGTESILHENSNSLIIAMNEEQLDTDSMMTIAKNIYKELVDDNTDAADPRIENYAAFREAVLGYDMTISAKQDVEEEINKLLSYGQQQLNPTVDSGENASESWNSYWRERLSRIEATIQKIPEHVMSSSGNMETLLLKDAEGKEISKAGIVQAISEYVRLYLTPLNDFEKYWTLLRGAHPYKTMLIFSCIVAFMIDLFSTATGILLYFYHPEKWKKKESG